MGARRPARERSRRRVVNRGPSGSGPSFARRYGSSEPAASTAHVPNRRTSRYTTSSPSSRLTTARRYGSSSGPAAARTGSCRSSEDARAGDARSRRRRRDTFRAAPPRSRSRPRSVRGDRGRAPRDVSGGRRGSEPARTAGPRGAARARDGSISTSGSSGTGEAYRRDSRRPTRSAAARRSAKHVEDQRRRCRRLLAEGVGGGDLGDRCVRPSGVARRGPRRGARRPQPGPRAWPGRRCRPRGRPRPPCVRGRRRGARRPARCRAPRPPVTKPDRAAATGRTTGAAGSAILGGSPPCAAIQRS